MDNIEQGPPKFRNNNDQAQGLYIKKFQGQESLQNEKTFVPLVGIDFATQINNNIAITMITQEYSNNFNTIIEVEYFFPIIPHVCFNELIIIYEDKVMKSKIKEKDVARQEYAEHKSKGNLVVESEILESSEDIVKVDIGNIHPNKNIILKFTYSEELQISQNKYWIFKILSTITSRYNNDAHLLADKDKSNKNPIDAQNQAIVQNMPQLSHKSKAAYKWKINLDVKSRGTIKEFFSSTHKNLAIEQDKKQLKIQITDDYPYQDFIFLYRNEQFNEICATLGQIQSTGQYCAMVSFVPKITEEQRNQNTGATYEFIFMIDRSGSMEGKRIEKTKAALIFFLEQLPKEGSLFNIYSFGSKFSKIFQKSEPINKDNIKNAISQIQRFSADLGGTEIYEPLQDIFKSQPPDQQDQKKYFRHIFLLTDGQISSPDQVIQLISANSKNFIFHTLGVGSGASHYLINQAANQGNGKFAFVEDNEAIDATIEHLLQAACSPILNSVQIKFDNENEIVEKMFPRPDKMTGISFNEPVNYFLLFNKNLKLDDINLYIELEGEELYSKFKSNTGIRINQNADFDHTIAKLGMSKLIKIKEQILQGYKEYENRIYSINDEITTEQEVINYSIQNQILSKYTAFICIIQEQQIKDLSGKQDPQKVIVPQISSKDYEIDSTEQHNNNQQYQLLTYHQKEQQLQKQKDLIAQQELRLKKLQMQQQQDQFIRYQMSEYQEFKKQSEYPQYYLISILDCLSDSSSSIQYSSLCQSDNLPQYINQSQSSSPQRIDEKCVKKSDQQIICSSNISSSQSLSDDDDDLQKFHNSLIKKQNQLIIHKKTESCIEQPTIKRPLPSRLNENSQQSFSQFVVQNQNLQQKQQKQISNKPFQTVNEEEEEEILSRIHLRQQQNIQQYQMQMQQEQHQYFTQNQSSNLSSDQKLVSFYQREESQLYDEEKNEQFGLKEIICISNIGSVSRQIKYKSEQQIQQQNQQYIIPIAQSNLLDQSRITLNKYGSKLLTKDHLHQEFGILQEIQNPKNLIGSGSFGKVYQCANKLNQQKYALKIIETQKQEIYDCSVGEVIIINKVNKHKNIMQIEKIFIYSESSMVSNSLTFFIVMAMPIADCSLEGYIKNQRGNPSMELGYFQKLAMDCVQGLYYLQQNDIYHFDIKPDNILILQGIHMIADFGTAKVIENKNQTTCLNGFTPLFLSPQMRRKIIDKEKLVLDYEKCDIWSLGCSLYCAYTLTTKEIFEQNFQNFTQIISEIKNLNNENVRNLLLGMLEEDQDSRFTYKDIIELLNKF